MMPHFPLRRLPKFALLAALAVGAFFFVQHLRKKAMHTLPYGFTYFKLSDPPPNCDTWKKHMPNSRDPSTYRLYIDARKVWRSKIEWQLTREEAIGILTDVRQAADQGDWGARALMAYFYIHGLGPLDPERAMRYNAIYDALKINPDLKFSRLDEVLPLPPAKLPDWRGIEDALEPESNGPPTY